MKGVDLRTVQELLGHKDIRMTMRYAHLAPDHMRSAVEILDRGADKDGRVLAEILDGHYLDTEATAEKLPLDKKGCNSVVSEMLGG